MDKVVMSDIMVTEKIPFTQRLQNSAASLFGQLFAGIAMICVAPFVALRILFHSERKVPDLSKIPVHLIAGEPEMMQEMPQGGFQMPTDEQVKEVNKQVIDMFDMREQWKKDHDEEYNEEDEQSED